MSEKMEEKIIINGFLINAHLPSEYLVQDILREYYKETVPITKLIQLVPNQYLNKFKTLRRKFYCQLVVKHAVKIASGWYLVPVQKLLAFKKDRDLLINEYKEFEQSLKEYLEKETEYSNMVKEIRPGNHTTKNNMPSIASRVSISLIPLSLSPVVFEKYIEEKAQEKKNQTMREIDEELRNTRKELINNAVMDLNERLEQLMRKLAEAARKKITSRALESLKNTVNNISELASATGTNYHVSERLKTASELIHSAETGRFSEKALELTKSEEISPRLKAFMEQLTKEK